MVERFVLESGKIGQHELSQRLVAAREFLFAFQQALQDGHAGIAIKQAMMQVVEMAAHEVNGQLVGQRVDIRLVDGDPELVVSSDDSRIPAPPPPPEPGEDFDTEARITLRLPGYLKELIAEAADVAGDSVNSFVVDALRSRAYRATGSTSVKKTIDL